MTDLPRPPVLSVRHALFLDFDGTLAPLQDDPDTVMLTDGAGPVLAQLADALEGAVALISGRDIADLARRVPAALWRIGNHGVNVLAPGAGAAARDDSAPDQLKTLFAGIAAAHPGTRVEEKGSVIALHYRARPDLKQTLLDAVAGVPDTAEGYAVQAGKMVIEAKPAGANKGEALTRLMQQQPFAGRVPLMVGDDATDEDGFEAALALGGDGVKVGDGETQAGYRLASPEAVCRWLDQGVEEGLSQ